jgi:hypothetical protein
LTGLRHLTSVGIVAASERATALRILASVGPTAISALARSLGYPVAPMAKRRTSGIQRRSRASETAMSRRIGPSGTSSALDPRLLIVGGVLVVGAIVLVVVLLFAGGSSQRIGLRQVDNGGTHVTEGQSGGPYSSVPATSGQHWNSATSPGPWGVYTTPQPQERLLHNLEHGGIVIWYQPALLDADGVRALTDYVQQQVRSAKFKVILAPWTGEDFEHPIAVTAWNWLLYLDTADIDQVRSFLDDHYGQAPEPLGGPDQPAQ